MDKHIERISIIRRSLVILAFIIISSISMAKTFYPFQELLFNFGVEDSNLVNSRDYNGDDVGNQSKPYGMVVDPEGKMWFGFHDGFSNEIEKSTGQRIRLTGIRCFINDTTEADFSPIELIEFPDDSKDTLYIGNPYNGYCRGISKDSNGNILYTAGASLYKLDYRDGSGIARFNPLMVGKPLRVHVSAVQDCSYIYFAPYPQFEQLNVLDTNLNFVSVGLPLTQTLENAIQVRTKTDGTVQLFSATHLNGTGILVYESPDPASQQFVLVDTIGNYIEETDTNEITYYAWANFMEWVDKEEGILIYGNDHKAYTTVNTGNPPKHNGAGKWILLDVDNNEMIAEIGAPWYEEIGGEYFPKEVNASVPARYLEYNAMGMTPSGAAVLIEGDHYGYYLSDRDLNCVQHVSWLTDIDQNNYIPYQLELSQNYPNPFNPLTNIRFEMENAQKVSLNIYDLSGKLVLRIFRGYLESGIHNFAIDAHALASGTYIYTLHTNSLSVSRKMTLLK